MSVNTNPFHNIIQLEEITHFQKPTKPIKSIPVHGYNDGYNKSSKTYTQQNSKYEGHGKIFNECSEPAAVEDGSTRGCSKKLSFHQEESGDGDNSSSEDEFQRDFRSHLKKHPQEGGWEDGEQSRRFFDHGISDENLFPTLNIEVSGFDVIFSGITFVLNVSEIIGDLTLAAWHYQTGHKWGCLLTIMFIASGGIALLQKFSGITEDQLCRIFRKGKRVRILVNCFPILSTSIVAFEGTMSSIRGLQDPMKSQQHFELSIISQCLSRTQSFFQAAPQSLLQLIILLENWGDSSQNKVWFTLFNTVSSLAVMTNANLPSPTDSLEASSSVSTSSAYKAAFLSRISLGFRMFSNLASRCMAVSFLLVGCRCLVDHLNNESESSSSHAAFFSTLIGLSLLLFPRLVFTITEHMSLKRVSQRNLEHFREQPELGISSSHPIHSTPLVQIALGYFATISFPMGEPPWLYWYLWCESGIFMIFGGVAAGTHSCLGDDDAVTGTYVGLFIVTFLIIPILVPAAKAAVSRRKIERVRRILVVPEKEVGSGANVIDDREQEQVLHA